MRTVFKLVLLGAALLIHSSWANKPREKQVVVAKATPAELYDRYSYPAQVESEIHAVVLAESTGILSANNLQLGSETRAGQKLFALKHIDPAYRGGSVDHYAPVSGLVSEIFQSTGSTVAKGDKVLLITDPKQLKMKIEVSAAQVRDLSIGQKGELVVPYSEKKYEVVIKGLSPILNAVTGTSSAELMLVNEDHASEVLVGTLGKVNFKVRAHQGIQVPEHAVVYEGKKPQIRIVKDEVLSRTDVVLGQKREGQIEILSGLESGEDYVLRANTYIKDGEKVVVTQ